MITPQQIEEIEKQAWQNMFDIAPENFRQEMKLYYEGVAGGICQVFPGYPVVHFNMVLGLGFTEPVTINVLQQVEAVYNKAGQPVYLIQFCESIQRAEPENVFELMNYRVGGIWERIVWYAKPVAVLSTIRNIHVELVNHSTANAWQSFILNLYHYPARDWLPAFVTDNWYNFIAIENDNIVAYRSIFINNDLAWSGIEAPVPFVMTNDLKPDRILWNYIQQFCLEKNVKLIVADIEMPSPERNTPIYTSFTELGFTVEYPRKLYRKNKV